VDSEGRLDERHLVECLDTGPVLAAVQAASNEIGTVQNLVRVGALCADRGVPLIVDATVAAGRVPLSADAMQATAVALSAHQWGGPRGTGALWLRPGTRLVPLIHGGIQENGLRAGTENCAGILASGAAARERRRLLATGLGGELTRRAAVLKAALTRDIPGLTFTGHSRHRLPGHVSCLVDVEGEALVLGLAVQGILASTGSTCSRADLASHVLKALGVSAEQARGSLVFSLGDEGGDELLVHVSRTTAAEVQRLRALAPKPHRTSP
jgi:cysteine desulfurase